MVKLSFRNLIMQMNNKYIALVSPIKLSVKDNIKICVIFAKNFEKQS